MKPLILASASSQRKKLLKNLELKFTIRPSQAQELTKLKTSCARLVMANALLKAQDVANRTSKGIVIGADTLVYHKKNGVIGKPRNLKEARTILKKLTQDPHWVYTGVAVIDAQSQKHLLDYEKTKVFMHSLSEQEISRYHKHISPLDKAGGFDIEGWGALFIHRIEGCYHNVIGLPLAKLHQMLKRMGVYAL